MQFLLLNLKSFLSTKKDALEFIQELVPLPMNTTCILALPSSLITTAREKIRGNPMIQIAAQDISQYGIGAYTGLENGQLLADLGAKYVIIGHPETRKAYALLDEDISAKINEAAHHDLTPIVYIASSFEYNDENESIESTIEAINQSDAESILIVYEDKEQDDRQARVKEVFKTVRKNLKIKSFLFVYAGSVDAETVSQLKKLKFIDGFAVGYHSLLREERQKIYEQLDN